MERALCLHRLPDRLPEGYQRLYFGAEFCPWHFPELPELKSALRACRAAGWSLSLLTPVLWEPFLPALRARLSELLPLFQAGDEVVISDWGAPALVRELAPAQTLVLGRVLSGQKRGPQILDLQLNEAQRLYFRSCRWHSREAQALLREQGIARIELDNLLQGLEPLPAALAGTLHHPYAMVTSSRNCPFAGGRSASGCPRSCGEVFTLKGQGQGPPLLQAGNTQFLRLDSIPSDLPGLGVDRLVEHPQLPR
jgi:antitoxin (DNA-binding transcriptional repressor) of toxin-antitoxin stability system